MTRQQVLLQAGRPYRTRSVELILMREVQNNTSMTSTLDTCMFFTLFKRACAVYNYGVCAHQTISVQHEDPDGLALGALLALEPLVWFGKAAEVEIYRL